MRWNVKQGRYHAEGEVYTRRRFAWLPVQIQDEWVWLEFFHERGTWQSMFDPNSGCGWMERVPELWF